MATMEVSTYKQVRQEQTEAFSAPEKNNDLLFWTMCQLRRTARTIDLLEVTANTGRISIASAIPDMTADVIENVLKARSYKFPVWHEAKVPHWFDQEVQNEET